jgi:hypothetical protein
MKVTTYNILFLCFLLIQCKADKISLCPDYCGIGYDLGYYQLSQSTIDLYPYDSAITQVVLADELGNEQNGVLVSSHLSKTWPSCGSSPCIDDSTNVMISTADVDSWSTQLDFIQLNLELRVDYYVSVDHKAIDHASSSDIARIVAYQINPIDANPIFKLDIEADVRNWTPNIDFAEPVDSITLNGRTFQNVYLSDTLKYPGRAYYSLTEGLISLQLSSQEPIYVLDRIE